MVRQDLGLTWREDAGGQVTILRRGKTAATLRGDRAQQFLSAVRDRSQGARQQLMARWTGNYRQGNERLAKDHPRNRPS